MSLLSKWEEKAPLEHVLFKVGFGEIQYTTSQSYTSGSLLMPSASRLRERTKSDSLIAFQPNNTIALHNKNNYMASFSTHSGHVVLFSRFDRSVRYIRWKQNPSIIISP